MVHTHCILCKQKLSFWMRFNRLTALFLMQVKQSSGVFIIFCVWFVIRRKETVQSDICRLPAASQVTF